MKGHLRKRGDRWALIVDLPRAPGEDRNQKWITLDESIKTRAQAEQEQVRILNDLYHGGFGDASSITLSEHMKQWMKSTPRRRTTAAQYQSHIDNHIAPALGHLALGEIKPHHVQSFLTQKLEDGRADGNEGGLSSRTVRDIHTILKAALNYAVEIELLKKNPASKASVAEDEIVTVPEYIDPPDVPTYLEAAKKSRYYPLLYTAVHTGMRQSELLGLRWNDIVNEVIHVSQAYTRDNTGKTGFEPVKTKKSRRSIDLSPSNVQVLEEWRERQAEERKRSKAYQESNLVFTTAHGTPYSHGNAKRAHTQAIERAGIPYVPFHALRHTHATILLLNGVPPKVVQERLGHSSISVTMDRYSHVIPSMQQAVASGLDDWI